MPEYAFTEKDRRRWAHAAAGAVAAAASRVRDRMAARLDGRSSLPSSPGAVFDQEEWAEEIAGEIDEAFRAVAGEAAGAFADGVGARSRFSEAAMQVMVGLVAAEVAGQLASRGEVVEARIETLLERGGEAGWDPAKLADELGLGEAASGPLSDALAEAMGTSAATSIAEGAAHGVIDLAGLTGYKTWHCMFRNSRDSHMDADLQTVPVDEPFVLENGEGMYPGDPDLPPEEAINCQCWVTYSVELPGGEVVEGEASAEEIEEALAAHAGPGPLVIRGPACSVHGIRSTSPVAPRRTLDAVTTAPFAIAPDSPAGQWVARSAAYSADLSGVIVSVEPTPLQKAALALPDGEPAERLHVTLCYLGSVDALDDEARRIIASVCASFGPQRGPIEGSVGGIGWFGSADAMTLGLIDAPGLSSLRSTVCSALADAGYPVVDDHDFTPHITLAYGQADAAAKVGMPLTFNELRLRWGTEVLAFDLIGPGAPPEAPAPMPEAPPAPPEEVPAVAENTAPAAPAAAAAGTRAAFGDEAPVDVPPTDIASIPDDALALELARRLASEAVRHVEDAGGTVPPAAHAMLEQEALHELGEALSDVVKDLVEDTAEAEAEEPEVPAEAEPAVPVSAAAIRARLRARAAQLAEEPMVGPDGQPVTPPAAVAPVVCPECGMEVVPNAEGLCPECGAFCSDGQVRLGVEEAAAGTDFEWEGVLTVEGVLSGDNRMIAEGCLTWRDLPIPLMLQTVNAPGHDGSVFCGWIHDVERVGANIIGRGTFTDDEAGAQARGILADPAGAKRFGVSVDIDSVQMVFADPSGAELSPDEAMEAHLFGGSADVVELLVAGRVMGATLTPFPAFQEAHVYLLGPNESAAPALVASASGPIWSATRPLTGFTLDGAEPTAALVASAAVTVDEEAPPAAWFQLEPMDEPIAFSVHPDGRCYGLVAQWGTCHIGDTARCVGVPRSNDFRSFYTGKQIVTREGTVLAVGPVIMDTVHPDLFMQASDAQAFYAHTGCAVADVRLYTNEHGIVAAGAVRPGIDRLTLRRFMASDISPDWRPISGEHRLVSLLAVNTSGFLVEGIAASAGRFQPWGIVDLSTGEVGALVAAGAVRRRPSVNEELAGLRAELADQRAVLAEQASLIEKLLAPHVAADRRARAAAALDALGLDCGCDEAADGERAARAAAALDKLGL